MQTNLPDLLYTAEQTRQLDDAAIHTYGIPGYVLMTRAGEFAFDVLVQHWPDAKRILVLCGTGNNGGDGYIIARLAHTLGFDVRVMQLGDVSKQHGDALQARQAMENAGIVAQAYEGGELPACDIIVDAMLGTGLQRDVEGVWRAAIEFANRQNVPRLAVDIPSGLNADSGAIQGACIQADVTTTFVGLKRGLFTGAGSEVCGKVLFSSLNIPEQTYSAVAAQSVRVEKTLLETIARRPRDAHKGFFGHVLLAGGNTGMSGAIRLAGAAALRTGSGLVSVGTRTEHAALIAQVRPELMCHGVDTATGLKPLLERATVLALGPGLGRDAWAESLVDFAKTVTKPMVWDADALNILAQNRAQKDSWILTPHPAEAARLLGVDTAAVQADRFGAAQSIQREYGGVCVLKGAGTIVAGGEHFGVCSYGNPGMASGGSGDVLTGIIAGVLAQAQVWNLDLEGAARLGVLVHALAADRAARTGEIGMIASDIVAAIRTVINHDQTR